MVRYAGFLADVSEGAVAVVMKQPTGHRRIDLRNAVVAMAVLVNAARFVQFLAEVDEAADEEIEAAVVVIVEPNRAGGPAWRGYARLVCYVRKSAVAIVMVKNAAAVLRDVQIGIAVTIVIANGYTLPETTCADACFLGHIGKGSVTIIFVQGIAQW